MNKVTKENIILDLNEIAKEIASSRHESKPALIATDFGISFIAVQDKYAQNIYIVAQHCIDIYEESLSMPDHHNEIIKPYSTMEGSNGCRN